MAPKKQKQAIDTATVGMARRGVGGKARTPASRRTATTFKYDCGAADVASIIQLNDDGDCLPFAQAINEIGVANSSLWCTCGSLLNGALAAFMLQRADYVADGNIDDAGALPYESCHHGDRPPAPRKQLRPQRDLALHLTQVAARVDQRLPHDQCSDVKFAWLPTFLWLPESVVRPTTVPGLMRFVVALVDDVRGSQTALEALFRKLSSKKRALAWYNEAATDAMEDEAEGTKATGNGTGDAGGDHEDGSDSKVDGDASSKGNDDDNSKEADDNDINVGNNDDDSIKVDGADSTMVDGADSTKVDGAGSVKGEGTDSVKVHGANSGKLAGAKGSRRGEDKYDIIDAAFLKANARFTDDAMRAAADADPSGWTSRRQLIEKMLAQWRFFHARGARASFMSFNHPWGDDALAALADAEYDAYLVAQLAAFDAMAGAFAAKCTLSVTYSRQLDVGGEQYTEEPSMAYFVGLSPDGHLVGSTTVVLPPI